MNERGCHAAAREMRRQVQAKRRTEDEEDRRAAERVRQDLEEDRAHCRWVRWYTGATNPLRDTFAPPSSFFGEGI